MMVNDLHGVLEERECLVVMHSVRALTTLRVRLAFENVVSCVFVCYWS